MSGLTNKLISIDKLNNEINNLTLQNNYEYIQMRELNHTLIHVAPLCNDEDKSNTGALDIVKYWDVEDNYDMSIINAQNIYSKMKWDESTLIRSSAMIKEPGLSMTQKESKGHISSEVNFFDDTKPSGYLNDFTTGVNAKTSLQLFGYFVPNMSGLWKFSLINTNIAQMWVSNDRALYEYTKSNANINSRTLLENNVKTFSIILRANEYYPIRIQLENSSAELNPNTILNVVSPTNELITKNTPEYNYFVSLLYNGELYLKKLLYFALVQSDRQKKNRQLLFQCVFIDPTPKNYETMKRLKMNRHKIFKEVEVPTKITYTSAKYNTTVSSDDNRPLNIKSPIGSNVFVVDSKYGLTKDRVVNRPIPQLVPETDPAKLVKQTNVPYTYRQGYNGNFNDATGQNIQSSYISPTPKKTIYKDNWVSIPSSFNTSNTNKKLASGNELNVGSNYNAVYGDPAPGYGNKLNSVNYRYIQDFDANADNNGITNKHIFLDKTGELVFGYDYNGTTNYSNISNIRNNEKCKTVENCNYYLVLNNDASISILNNLNVVIWTKRVNIITNSKSILVNREWLNDPEKRETLNQGDILSPHHIKSIVSKNGKYKLKFEDGKIIVKYSVNAFNEITGNKSNETIRYTDSSIRDNGHQIYYLYRVNASGTKGQRFLSKTSKIRNPADNTLFPLSNTANQILQFKSYNNNYNAFPLLKSSEYDAILNTTSTGTIEYKYNIHSNLSPQDCKQTCTNDYNCEHYFDINTSNGKKCLTDISDDSNPKITYTKPHPGINKSNLASKNFIINTKCPNIEQSQPIKRVLQGKYAKYNIMYNKPTVNNSLNTYYCAEDTYINNNQRITDIYSNRNGFTTMEGYTIMDEPINDLATNALLLQNKQEEVVNKYYNTIDNINLHNELSQRLDEDENQKYDSDKIVSKMFQRDILEPEPDTTIEEANKRDTNNIILQQNTLYTMGTISAATLLVFAILLAKD
jgi:hypothetical protein